MGEEADADWQSGLIEWGRENAKMTDPRVCQFCTGSGRDEYLICFWCRGTGLAALKTADRKGEK